MNGSSLIHHQSQLLIGRDGTWSLEQLWHPATPSRDDTEHREMAANVMGHQTRTYAKVQWKAQGLMSQEEG